MNNQNQKSLWIFGIAFYIIIAIGFMQAEKKVDKLQEQVDTLTNELSGNYNLDFYWTDNVKLSAPEEHILAKNIYYESGVEGYSGKLAVAQVTLNRLESGKWGNTIKEVVYSPSQFSWTLKKKLEEPSGALWEESKRVARDFNRGLRIKELDSATSYHSDSVKPKWAVCGEPIIKIGKHIFYRG